MGRYEQPTYTVVSETPDYEIRRYDSYLVAETVVEGAYDETGTAAFRRLAGFIFGRNAESRKMKMTVPVTHETVGAGLHRYRFVMERAFDEDTLPAPIDPSVSIQRLPGGHVAAARYRGGRGEQRFRRVETAVRQSLSRDGVEVSGPSVAAVYDGPMVPPPFRRNEVLVPVDVG